MPISRKSVIDLRNEGKTYPEIGNILGISKQRAHAIFEKFKHVENPDSYQRVVPKNTRNI